MFLKVIASELNEKLNHTIESHVPSKMSSVRCSQPWFNTHTKRACRRKARAYRKARRTNKKRDWDYFRLKRREAQHVCRHTYNRYVADLVHSAADGNKRLGSLVKSKRCDQLGVAPLKDGNLIHPDPRTKANILNRQFASVFVQDDSTSSPVPDLGPGFYPTMPNITVNQNGVIKLLKNINPHKASGPDGIPGKLLKEIAVEVSPAIVLLFQASIDQGKVPSSWKKALVTPIFRVTVHVLPTTDLSH